MIPFNKPTIIGTEINYIKKVIKSGNLCGNGIFTKSCEQWLEQKNQCLKILLTSSCTAALEMAAILLNIKPGDEVIMPSFTFVSTSNAFVLRGAHIVFVDISPYTMNIDEKKIELAITNKTRVIVVVHYAGISCNMDAIMALSNKYSLYVVEDAAQGVMSAYKNKALGTIGHIGCYSFHETKNYSSGGEGGAIAINISSFIERAEIIREKGTDRSKFYRKQVSKYTWKDIGSSYLMSELQAAYLLAQLENADKINQHRLILWQKYYQELSYLVQKNINLPFVPEHISHNAHIFYIKFKNLNQKQIFIEYMKKVNIMVALHYIPLHLTFFAKKNSIFFGKDSYTSKESQRLVRLPIFYNLTYKKQKYIITKIKYFFKKIFNNIN